MVNYIKEYKNIFDENFCKDIIDLCQTHQNQDALSYWKRDSTNNYLKEMAIELEKSISPYVKDYFELFSGLISLDDISLENFLISKQSPGHFDSLHYDTPIYQYKDSSGLRPFICMIYLNHKEFKGGQVIFPIQKYILEPECGKLVFFPTSFQFPRMLSSITGGERYSIRVTMKLASIKLNFNN